MIATGSQPPVSVLAPKIDQITELQDSVGTSSIVEDFFILSAGK